MKDRLTEALQSRFPELKPYVVSRCVDKYVHAVIQELARRFALATKEQLAAGELDFAENAANEASGRVCVNGHYHYIYTLMNQHPQTSLVHVTYKGNSLAGRVSRVTINQQYRKEIMHELQNLTIELDTQRLDELDLQANASWDVDPESLESFIRATRLAAERAPNRAYEEKCTRNLLIAQAVLERVKVSEDGKSYVDEYWEEIDSGRIHGHGISLQRIPKEVRHAALGHCHRYDFKASNYALMTDLALNIRPDLRVAALRDYVKNRSQIRTRIARDVGISDEWMKQVFTSLGFGAELKDNPHNAIRGQLGQEKYARLMANSEFAMIAYTLGQVTDTINRAFPDTGFELCGRTYTQTNPRDGRRRTRNQKLAWIYQCLESHAMSLFRSFIPDEYQTLLLVHDCIYLDRRLPAQHIADIKWQLSQVYPTLNFDHEEISPIHAPGDHGRKNRERVDQEHAHSDFIAEQESLAADYRSVHTEGNSLHKKPQIMTPWGMIDADLYEPHQSKEEYFKDRYFKGAYS